MNKPPSQIALIYTLHEAETIAWALSVVCGLERTPTGTSLLDKVPQLGRNPPFRGEYLINFGRKFARDLDNQAHPLIINPSSEKQ